MHLELIAASATQPNTGAAGAAVTGGETLTVKNSKSAAYIIAMWAHLQVDGYIQLTHPSAHDTTRGLRLECDALSVVPRIALGIPYEVQPQELLSVQIAGSNTAGDVETACYLVKYKDLPGVNSRLIAWPELQKRAAKLLTVQATVTGTAAGWSGAELITAESDLLRANQDYAVLGIEVADRCAAVAIYGPDTGYQKCAVPGEPTRGDLCGSFFATLARMYDEPCIPVINSGNKAATFLSVLDNENAGAIKCSVNLALLD